MTRIDCRRPEAPQSWVSLRTPEEIVDFFFELAAQVEHGRSIDTADIHFGVRRTPERMEIKASFLYTQEEG